MPRKRRERGRTLSPLPMAGIANAVSSRSRSVHGAGTAGWMFTLCPMPSQISEARPDIPYEQIASELTAILDEVPPLEDPAEFEQLAVTLLIALEQPEIPAEVLSAVLEAIQARRDANAAGVLAAFGALATEPLAEQARAGEQRLAGEGIVSDAATGIGTLAVAEAVRIESASAELLVVLLARPGASAVQAAILGIEHQETAGALVDCGLTPPAPLAEARELLHGVDGATAPQPIQADELAARVLAAARRAVEAEIALGPEAGPALPIISLVLTGDPAGLPRPGSAGTVGGRRPGADRRRRRGRARLSRRDGQAARRARTTRQGDLPARWRRVAAQ